VEDNLDFGSGYTGRTFTCEETEPESCGLLLAGPAAPQCPHPSDGRCGGGIHFENAPEKYVRRPDGTLRPRWKVESRDPLTLSPSIVCGCGGQHGHIRSGRYENAGGVVT
jgi:hypothetical protein